MVTRSMPPFRKKRGGWPGDRGEFPGPLNTTREYGSPAPSSVVRDASCFAGYWSGLMGWLTRAWLIRLLVSALLLKDRWPLNIVERRGKRRSQLVWRHVSPRVPLASQIPP